MGLPTRFLRPGLSIGLFLLLSCTCRAGLVELRPGEELQKGIRLQKNFRVFEDVFSTGSAASVLSSYHLFPPLSRLKPQNPTSTYWLASNIQSRLPESEIVLFFTHLTFVDLYLYQDGHLLHHRQAGAFRPQKDIHPDDSRFHFRLPLQAGKSYTLLLKVKHTKHYQPNFDFTIQPANAFADNIQRQKRADYWMQGAVGVFFLYTLLSLLVSRYRPYLWLLIFIAGVSLYALSMRGYFVDWFFPNTPETGWLFNIHFMHLGLVGIYMLILDFWHLKQKSLWLYRWGQLVVAGVFAVAITSLCINVFTSNYNLMNSINVWSFIFPFSFISYTLWCCWRSLNRAQRYLAWGIVLFALAGVVTSVSAGLLLEKSQTILPYISHSATLGVVLLFSTGLKEDLRLYEIEKNAALQQLTILQQQQNSLLEQKVAERTAELQKSNQGLTQQQVLLAERNQKIEVLINELNHRVKNNLQLLYSLIHLQLPGVQDAAAQELLKGNIAKIRAMMLVNEQFARYEEQPVIHLNEFCTELIRYIQNIFDPGQKVQVVIQIPEDITLKGRDSQPFGLILTELMTNAFKYAFTDQPAPCIHISASHDPEKTFQFQFRDNGKGLADPDHKLTSSMGMMLIRDLTRQMNGAVILSGEGGLAYQFTFSI